MSSVLPVMRHPVGPIAQSTTATGSPVAPVTPVTWDAATKGADLTLSNGDLTGTTTQYDNWAAVRSTNSHSSGKYAITGVFTYPGDPWDGEVAFGFCTEGFDTIASVNPLTNALCWSLVAGGGGYHDSNNTVCGQVLTTEAGFLYIDFDAGKMWLDNDTQATAADREAGINENFAFAPNTEFYAFCSLFSNDPPLPVSLDFDPTFSSGTFLAWQ